MKYIVSLIIIAMVVVSAKAFMFFTAVQGSSSEIVAFDIPRGASFSKIAPQLEKKGLIESAAEKMK